MSQEYDKIIARILREAGGPGAEHERLRGELAAWANARGYTKLYSEFESGSKPDVLRGTPDDKYLFVGDAKDSANETAENTETMARIAGYIREFARHLGDTGYRGGLLAIATNSAAAAAAWVPTLNILARAAGITAGAVRTPPNFQVVVVSAGQTWVVYW